MKVFDKYMNSQEAKEKLKLYFIQQIDKRFSDSNDEECGEWYDVHGEMIEHCMNNPEEPINK